MALVFYPTSSKWLRYEEVTSREQTNEDKFKEQFMFSIDKRRYAERAGHKCGKKFNNGYTRKVSMRTNSGCIQGK